MTNEQKISFVVNLFTKIENNRAIYLKQEGFENLKIKEYFSSELSSIKKYCNVEQYEKIKRHKYNDLDYELIAKNISIAVKKDAEQNEAVKEEIRNNNDERLIKIILQNIREEKNKTYLIPKNMKKRAEELITQNKL